jgi:thymidylate kinase
MKQSIIIFDGPDMVGKTQMARALANQLKIPYFKNSAEALFGKLPIDYYVNASQYIDTYMPGFLSATGQSIIFDRNYPSEYAYPRVFNRPQDMRTLFVIDEAHAKLGTKIIIPYRSSYAGIRDNVHSTITSQKLMQLDKIYAEFVEWTQCKVLHLNVDDQNLTRELNDINNFLEN